MSTEQQSKPDLTWDEAMALAKTDAPQLAARLRGDKTLVRNGPSLWPSKHVHKVRALRWRWWLTDPDSDNSIADGYALTENWAWHRAGQAAARVYTERAEAAKRQAES